MSNRLNELVEKSGGNLQRLLDVSCQLMLADRQQEELVNYVNAFMNGFEFCEGERWRRGGAQLPPVYVGSAGMDLSRPAVKPYILQVFPCQGTYSSIESLTEAAYVAFNGNLPLKQFLNRFEGGIVPSNAYWVGFVSDVYARGKFRFAGKAANIYEYKADLRPFAVASPFGADYDAQFRKLTDTSPLISKTGNIQVDLLTESAIRSISAQNFLFGYEVLESLKGLTLENTFRFSFNYVGVGIVLG